AGRGLDDDRETSARRPGDAEALRGGIRHRARCANRQKRDRGILARADHGRCTVRPVPRRGSKCHGGGRGRGLRAVLEARLHLVPSRQEPRRQLLSAYRRHGRLLREARKGSERSRSRPLQCHGPRRGSIQVQSAELAQRGADGAVLSRRERRDARGRGANDGRRAARASGSRRRDSQARRVPRGVDRRGGRGAAMTSAAKRMGSVKGPLAIAIGMLLLMVFLLVMSNRTGQRTSELAKQQLDSVEAANVRMDGALFMSLSELQIAFDLLARLQAEMRTAGEELASVLPGSGQTVLRLLEPKLEAVEAFKSNQAIFRNSRAIAGQLIAELWQRPEVRVGEADRILFDVERAMLDFVGRRDAESSQRLVAALERAASARVPLTELEEWHALVEHAETLIDYTNRLGAALASEVFYQFPVVLYEEGSRLAQGLAVSVAKAGLYR